MPPQGLIMSTILSVESGKSRQLHALMQLFQHLSFIWKFASRQTYWRTIPPRALICAGVYLKVSYEDNFKKEICFLVEVVLVRLLVGIKQISPL